MEITRSSNLKKALALICAVIICLCAKQPAFASWPAYGQLAAYESVIDPNTGQDLLVVGYSSGRLDFRDWQGNILSTRSGFDEITAIEAYRSSDSPLPRLFVGSTDSNGTLRIINPANINNDLATQSDLGCITALYAQTDCIYVGTTDAEGTLIKLNNVTLAEEAVRSGLGEITAIMDVWDGQDYLLVASTDSNGTLRMINPDTLVDAGSARSGFNRIYALATDDIDLDGTAEIVVASSDERGTVRYIEADNLFVDKAVRSGFGTIYAVEYGLLGVAQCDGNGKASIIVACSNRNGAIWIMDVDIASMSTMLDYSSVGFGFGEVTCLEIADLYDTGIGVLNVISKKRGNVENYIFDESLDSLLEQTIPPFSIKRVYVKAGRIAGQDRIKIDGCFGAGAADVVDANQIHIKIYSEDANLLVYSESIDFDPIYLNGGIYQYRYRVGKGEPGAITQFYFDMNRHIFSLAANNIDLTGLECPMLVVIELGTYTGTAYAYEDRVCGRNSIPIELMSGYADRLRIDKLKVRLGGNLTSDSLVVKGAIAFKDQPDTLDDIVLTFGTQTFTIPGSCFYTNNNGGIWRTYRNSEVLEGGIVRAQFNLNNCSFKISIKETTINSNSGEIDLGISTGSFDETVEVDL